MVSWARESFVSEVVLGIGCTISFTPISLTNADYIQGARCHNLEYHFKCEISSTTFLMKIYFPRKSVSGIHALIYLKLVHDNCENNVISNGEGMERNMHLHNYRF